MRRSSRRQQKQATNLASTISPMTNEGCGGSSICSLLERNAWCAVCSLRGALCGYGARRRISPPTGHL
eukprot:scaffold1954_cov268-Pinguiococcus_pyrenoidosus.AAC.111